MTKEIIRRRCPKCGETAVSRSAILLSDFTGWSVRCKACSAEVFHARWVMTVMTIMSIPSVLFVVIAGIDMREHVFHWLNSMYALLGVGALGFGFSAILPLKSVEGAETSVATSKLITTLIRILWVALPIAIVWTHWLAPDGTNGEDRGIFWRQAELGLITVFVLVLFATWRNLASELGLLRKRPND